jgi:hypothetical protein
MNDERRTLERSDDTMSDSDAFFLLLADKRRIA